MKKTVPSENQGTPTSLLLSIVCTIVVFAIAEIQSSFALDDNFAMRYVLMSYVALGLTLAFFWKRLQQSPFLKISSVLYLFGLWVSLFVTTLAPILLDDESPLISRTIIQQFGLGFVVLSGISLMVGLLQNQKLVPSLLFSGLGAVGLLMTSGGSILFKARTHPDDMLSSVSHAGKKEAASHEKEDEEEITAKSAAHGHGEEGEHAESAHGEAPGHGEAPPHGEGHHEAADHGEEPAEHGAKEITHEEPKALNHEIETHAPKPTPQHPVKAISHKNEHIEKPSAKKVKVASKASHDDEEAALPLTAKKKAVVAPAAKTKAEASTKGKDAAVRWAYDQGETSPAHWGELTDQYRVCGVGQQQSPIDIPTSWPLLSDVTLDYKLTPLTIVDNGHTIQFKVGDQNYATIAGRRYKLVEFHIHTPSEHWIDGRLSPMEIHFVHKDERNQLAYISVMVEPGKEAQKTFAEMWSYVPQGIDLPATPRGKLFNIASLVPAKPKVYRYRGSLTTPPCTEGVLWSVVSDKLDLSAEQIDAFKTHYKNNARPVQKRSVTTK